MPKRRRSNGQFASGKLLRGLKGGDGRVTVKPARKTDIHTIGVLRRPNKVVKTKNPNPPKEGWI